MTERTKFTCAARMNPNRDVKTVPKTCIVCAKNIRELMKTQLEAQKEFRK